MLNFGCLSNSTHNSLFMHSLLKDRLCTSAVGTFCFSVAWWRHQMETFSALLALCVGNSPVTGESPHKGQWRGALMFSLICSWINTWVHNREAGDVRRHRAHYDVSVIVRPSGLVRELWAFISVPVFIRAPFCWLCVWWRTTLLCLNKVIYDVWYTYMLSPKL